MSSMVGRQQWGAAAGASLDLGPRRLPAFLGAVLIGIAALALVTLHPAPAPSSRPMALRDGLQSRSATLLPMTLAPAASASIGASEHRFWPVRSGASLITGGGGIDSTFAASRADLRVAQGTLSLSLTGVGRGQRLEPLATVAPTGVANQVVYRHGWISEFYRSGPYGLEQGFNLQHRPQAGSGSLVLALGVRGSLIPGQVGSEILLRTRAGTTALRYGQLSAADATGRLLPAHMQLRRGTLRLVIDDRGARYPLRIDPFVQQGEKLIGGEHSGTAHLGWEYSVALSSDGNTALIGGWGDNEAVGAAWVFTRSGSTWTQQGAKLTTSEAAKTTNFGWGVALSSDGNTALIGGPNDNGGVGAVWVFTRSGSTWTQQGTKLTGGETLGASQFGRAVALSSDGNTALIGGLGDNGHKGAAWVFTRSGTTWTQQGPKLTGGGEIGNGEFGESVALSSDGNTALIGGEKDGEAGAAWVFTRSGESWTQQAKFTGTEEFVQSGFGWDVALSSDGNTALIGGLHDNGYKGAAWVFTRSGTTWTQQGPKLTGGGEIGSGAFGMSVALSSDGHSALIGGPNDNEGVGAAWVFTRSGTTWTQQGPKLTGGGEIGSGAFGMSVALSSDGHTALIGGPNDNSDAGAAWTFVTPPPTVVTESASSVTQTSAMLNATVNPNGEEVSDCHFEYGVSEAYAFSTPCTSLPGAGESPVGVSAPVTGLSAKTTYHFRVVATNANGTSYGSDQTFATVPPEAPEFGRCLKVAGEKVGTKTVYHGGFTAATCLEMSGTKTGKYEWYSGVVKAGFTTTIKEGVATLETVTKLKVSCKIESGKGQYGPKIVASVVLKFTGCESTSQKCTTPGLAEGELETKKLEGTLGWQERALKKVALDLYPSGKSGPFMEYRCVGGASTTVTGSILVPVTVDKMLATATEKYTETAGKQKPEHFEGEPNDVLTASLNGEVFEQLGEKATLTQVNEEAVEINAVV